jgi:hypothetical protein
VAVAGRSDDGVFVGVEPHAMAVNEVFDALGGNLREAPVVVIRVGILDGKDTLVDEGLHIKVGGSLMDEMHELIV